MNLGLKIFGNALIRRRLRLKLARFTLRSLRPCVKSPYAKAQRAQRSLGHCRIFALVVLGCCCFACGPAGGPGAVGEPAPAPTAEVKKNAFEEDLAGVRYNEYKYIFVLRRRDGKVFEGEDSKFIREKTPAETNQRVLSDEGKAVIMGMNSRFYPGQWDALNKRYEVQDLSAEKYVPNENDDSPPANKTLKKAAKL